MNDVLKIKQNSIYSFLTITVRLIASTLIFLLIPRFYDAESFGQFTFAHTLSTTLIILADFGFDILLTIEIARNKQNASKIFQQFFLLKFVFSFCAMLVMWTLAYLFDVSSTSKTLIIIFSFFLLFTSLTNFIYALFKGYEKFEYETNVSFIMNVSLLVVTIILIIYKINFIVLAIVFVISRILGFIVGLFYTKRILPDIKYSPSFKGFFQVKNNIFIFGFHLFFSYLFFQLDTILLALWKGEYYVGIYQLAFKLIMLPLIIPEILTNVLLPVLTKIKNDNFERWTTVGYFMNKILLIIVLPLTIILFTYAENIINIIYGENYIEAIPVLKIFSFVLLIRFSLETYALMLTTSDRQKVRLNVVLVATVINFIMNSFLIPKYGVIGAAVVSLLTNTFVGISFFYSERKLFKTWTFNTNTYLLIIVSVIIFYLFSKIFSLNMIFGIPIIVISYLIYGLFYFTKNEKELLKTDVSGLRLWSKNN